MKILVAGAGIAGLAFVRSLQMLHTASGCFKDIELIVAERASSFGDGVGIVLHPNGLRVLDILGLSASLQPLSQVIETLRIKRGSEAFGIDLHEAWGCDGYLTRSILRKDLHTLLQPKEQPEDGLRLEIRTGLRLEGIRPEGAGISVCFDTGENETFDLVIGADGVHSRVRAAWFPESRAVSTGLLYFRFLARNPNGENDREWQTVERGDCSYGFIPLADGLVHCFIQLPLAAAPDLSGGEASFLAGLQLDDELFFTTLQNRCSPIQSGFAWLVPPGNWYRDNVVLLGDAAHAVSPTLSQGGSLGLEDGLVLAVSLAEGDLTESLAAYRAARQEKCLRAYRMALAQLNALSQRRTDQPKSGGADAGQSAALMKSMYRPLLANDLPQRLQRIFAVRSPEPTWIY